ncbi:MAG: FumA C-terminus/TtdB family hydratase beta subunit [Planctomycetota bacterium]
MNELQIPLDEDAIRALNVGDVVSLTGVIVTARDAAHKYLIETFIEGSPAGEDVELGKVLGGYLRGGVIYHCGPVVAREGEKWRFVAAGPTTSIREEPYEAQVIGRFGVRGIIGKGGMGASTSAACREHGCVYLHTVGGAATYLADSVEEVLAVHKEEFGTPEAFWVIRARAFPVVVTMDAKGRSLHEEIRQSSGSEFSKLLGL